MYTDYESALGPDLAQRLSDAHENMPEQPADERTMDLHNNYAGILIGLDPSNTNVEQTVVDWLHNGRLKIIENDAVVPSHP